MELSYTILHYNHFGPRSVLGHFDPMVTMDTGPANVISGHNEYAATIHVQTSISVYSCCLFSYFLGYITEYRRERNPYLDCISICSSTRGQKFIY